MMFHAFGVALSRVFSDADRTEKGQHDFVAGARRVGDGTSPLSEKDAAIRPAGDQAHRLDARHGLDHRGMGDAEAVRDIDRPSLALGIDQIGDHFDIVFGNFRAASIPRGPEVFGAFFGANVEQCFTPWRAGRPSSGLPRSGALHYRLALLHFHGPPTRMKSSRSLTLMATITAAHSQPKNAIQRGATKSFINRLLVANTRRGTTANGNCNDRIT